MSLYAVLAAALFFLGLHGLFTAQHRLRTILALNVMSAAVFLLLVVLAARADVVDPVPHAMVLTGIVVSVGMTAVAVTLVVHLSRGRGRDRDRRG